MRTVCISIRRRLGVALLAAAALMPASAPLLGQMPAGERPRFIVESGALMQPALEELIHNAGHGAALLNARAILIQFVDCESQRCGDSLAALQEFIHSPAADEDLLVIGVAVRADQAAADQLRTARGITFPLLSDPDGKLFKDIATAGVPRTLVYDGDRKLVYTHAGWQPGREAEFRAVAEAVLEGRELPAAARRRPPLFSGERGNAGRDEAMHARDIRGQQAPEVPIEVWITNEPTERDGKFLLVDFWATWCGPCIHTLDVAEKEHARFDSRLVSIAISDEGEAVVSRFVKSRGWKQAIAIDTKARAKRQLEVQAIPHGFLADPSGKVIWQGHPAELWMNGAARLEQILDSWSPEANNAADPQ